MADTTQDFNINIRTLADLTGIKLTQQGLDALQTAAKQGNIASIEALKQLSAAQKEAQAAAAASSAGGAGFTGAAIGVGTIVTLLTHAITAVKRFEEEQDKIIQKMEEAREKTYELGLSVADTLDELKDAERLISDPLAVSFDRLTNKVKVLKSELQIAFETGAYEDAKRYVAQLRLVESQLDRITAATQRQAQAAAQAAQQQQEKAYGGASPQAKAILANEKAAREARAAGDEKSADQFQKSADQFRASASESDLANVQAVTDAYGKAAEASKRQPEPGEPGGGEVGTGGPSLIGDEARKARQGKPDDLGLADEVGFRKQQALLRTAHESKMAAQERHAANHRLAAENQAGTIERQTQNANRNPDRDTAKAIQALADKFDRYWGN